jgi:hypothetical protein
MVHRAQNHQLRPVRVTRERAAVCQQRSVHRDATLADIYCVAGNRDDGFPDRRSAARTRAGGQVSSLTRRRCHICWQADQDDRPAHGVRADSSIDPRRDAPCQIQSKAGGGRDTCDERNRHAGDE